MNVSPDSMIGWGILGGWLHYSGQDAALRAANEYIQRAPEPTLTVDNLTVVLDTVQEDMYYITQLLHIPDSKIEQLQQQYGSGQVNTARADYIISHHPAPSWTIVADVLWFWNAAGALEMVQKLYLKGTSESRRLFQQSMKKGHVDMYNDKMLLYGSAGVGKTCTMKIVTGEKPPVIQNSTPIATKPVTMYQLQIIKGKWQKYISQDRMKLCARISKTTLGREIIKAMKKAKIAEAVHRAKHQEVDCGCEQKTSTAASPQQPIRDSTLQNEDPTPKPKASSQSSVDRDVLQVIHDVLDEMFQLIDEYPETEEPLTFIHKLLVSDCGGQPQFHEILPIFLRRMSLIVFVFKLSESFSSRPMIEYYEDGKALGTPYESHHTTEQLIKEGLQSLYTHRSSKGAGKDGEAPQIVMVGTHKDEERKCDESRETKDQKLREMLLPTFEKEIIYYDPGENKVLFPMNAKCPGIEEEDIAQAIISRFSTENRSDAKKLPLQWLGFETMLEEITQRLKRGILSRNECLEVAYRLQLDESALDAALIYLDELSLVFYYPDILPEIVFTNPQVLLDKITELVKVHHDKLKRCTGEDWQKFFCHALVTVEFLQDPIFKKHYIPGMFEPKHLILLYQKLLIFADFSEGEFFVPSLLRMLSNQELSTQRLLVESIVAPLVLHFPDGPPCRGIFCAIISFLTSPENHFPDPWALKKPARSVTPTCLHRNCIQFMIPCAKTPCTVTLIDTLLQFEIHMSISSAPLASKLCSTIKDAISTALRKANLVLGYTNSTSSFALLCPCGKGDAHHATIGDGCWICTLDVGVGEEFDASQLFWTMEDSPSEGCADQEKILSTHDSTIPIRGKPSSQHYPTAEAGCEVPTTPAELSLQDVAAQAGLKTLDVLDQECSQQVLLRLAKHCVDWQLTGFHLELTKSDIVAVDEDYRTAEQKRVEMLRMWKEKFAFKATYRVFIKALLSCGKASDAIDACRAILLLSSIKVSAEDEKGNLKFSSTMSDDNFFKWLRIKGISEKDCNTLSENGVTASGFSQLGKEDFEDLGLTKIGKKLILKILPESK